MAFVFGIASFCFLMMGMGAAMKMERDQKDRLAKVMSLLCGMLAITVAFLAGRWS